MAKHRAEPASTTQNTHPWRATVRTVFEAVVALAAAAPVIYSAIVQDDPTAATGAAAIFLGVAAAITRVMALPVVDDFLRAYVPFLASSPRGEYVAPAQPEPLPQADRLGA